MIKDFTIEDVKAGDMLIAHNEDGSLAHSWLVLSNNGNTRDGDLTDFVEAYVIYAQSGIEKEFSFFYSSFKSDTFQKANWSLQRVS